MQFLSTVCSSNAVDIIIMLESMTNMSLNVVYKHITYTRRYYETTSLVLTVRVYRITGSEIKLTNKAFRRFVLFIGFSLTIPIVQSTISIFSYHLQFSYPWIVEKDSRGYTITLAYIYKPRSPRSGGGNKGGSENWVEN
uniref:Uncharacterized protein n=1 Tax=Glossina brevipalpis TaxID=37001 RepID=A0A1A9WQ04_9MUSC